MRFADFSTISKFYNEHQQVLLANLFQKIFNSIVIRISLLKNY